MRLRPVRQNHDVSPGVTAHGRSHSHSHTATATQPHSHTAKQCTPTYAEQRQLLSRRQPRQQVVEHVEVSFAVALAHHPRLLQQQRRQRAANHGAPRE